MMMAFGIFDTEMEWAQQLATLEQDDTPFRVVLVPFASGMDGGDVGPERIDAVRAFAERTTHRLKFTNHVKLFADGGLFSGLSQFGPPGRIDGADGEWMMAPEIFEKVARLFWDAGFQIHVHCSAELGLDLAHGPATVAVHDAEVQTLFGKLARRGQAMTFGQRPDLRLFQFAHRE